ncbi:hypothetical protein AWN90_10560 [Nocardia terpenica]|uniref:DNA (cytosine-5-)-methyltransferase n=3 Tax=Nocardia terpenica TaxID=455432 RepID=A0A164H9T6_9NOCA|nr:hypothetical protein AWN90_10560 [Nocardia terpenica]
MLPSAVHALGEGELLPTPTACDGTGGGVHPDRRRGRTRQLVDYALVHGSSRWGAYAAAIARQEALTRAAPSPTEPNKNGKPRLSAAFAEWMMMMPSGWVTDPVIGLSRVEQLRLIGNAVVTPCAVVAFSQLFARTRIEVPR